MTAQEVLAQVRERGVALAVIDGRLKAAPPGLLPADLKAAIRDRAAEIKALLPITQERNRWPVRFRAPMPLRRCGALVCRTCHVHSPSPHREGCAFPQFDPCRSRWFWLSPHGAIKCIACAAPSSLELVEAWVLARETGEGADGWRIPGEILSALHVHAPLQ
jgi:hypothetical protein